MFKRNECSVFRAASAIFLTLVFFPIFYGLFMALVALCTVIITLLSYIVLIILMPRTLYINCIKSRNVKNMKEFEA